MDNRKNHHFSGSDEGEIDIAIGGDIDAPGGAAYADGYFWVYDLNNDLVYKLNTDGSATGENFSITGGDARGITSYNYTLYASDQAESDIARYNHTDGTLLYTGNVSDQKSGGSSYYPLALKFINGYFLALENNTTAVENDPLYRYNPDLSFTNNAAIYPENISTPAGIEFADGYYYIVDNAVTFNVFKYYGVYLNKSEFSKGDIITINATPSIDGIRTGVLQSVNFTVQNTPPTNPTTLTLTPVNISDTLTATCSGSTDIDSGDSTTYYYEFYNINDTTVRQVSSTTNTYVIAAEDVHDSINVTCEAYDGTDYSGGNYSNTTIVDNTIPTNPTSLSLNQVNVSDTLTATCSGSTDGDSDSITYYYEFYNFNDTTVRQAWSTTNTYVIAAGDAHDIINVTCGTYDSREFSTGNYSNTRTVSNSPPTTPLTLSLSEVNISDSLTATCSGSTDPDGDSVTYYYKFVNVNDSSTVQAWSTTNNYIIALSDAHDFINVTCGASDGILYSTGNITSNKTVDNQLATAGAITINSSDGTNYSTVDIGCYTTLTDNDNDTINVTVRWYRNNTLMVTEYFNNSYNTSDSFSATLDNGNLTDLDFWNCSIRTDDGYDFGVWKNSSNITMVSKAPTVTLEAPTNNNYSVSVGEDVDYTCSAISSSYELINISLHATANGTWQQIASETRTGTSNSSTFTINPTTFFPGQATGDTEITYNCLVFSEFNSSWAASNYTFGSWDLGEYVNSTRNSDSISLSQNSSGQYPNTTGNYTSRVIPLGDIYTPLNITWDEAEPIYGEPLPDNGLDELLTVTNGTNMTGNVLLMHFEYSDHDDFFTDAEINTTRWNNSSGPVINSGKIRMAVPSSASQEVQYISSIGKWNLSGPFSVRASWDEISVPSANLASYALRVYDGEEYYEIKKIHTAA